MMWWWWGGGLAEKVTLEQGPEGRGERAMRVPGRRALGSGNSQGKYPEAGTCLQQSRSRGGPKCLEPGEGGPEVREEGRQTGGGEEGRLRRDLWAFT